MSPTATQSHVKTGPNPENRSGFDASADGDFPAEKGDCVKNNTHVQRAPLPLTPVEPISRVTVHMRDGTSYDRCEYPPSPRGVALLAFRRQHDVWLAEGAEVLGIAPAQLVYLEQGSLTTDWDEAERRLRAYAEGRS